MIWHHIKAILNYWRIKKANATPEQIVILKLRIDAARENHSAGMLKNNDLFAWSNEHYQEITPDGFYCSCTAFATSAPTGGSKLPCKHLYVFAHGIITNF